MNLKVKSCSKCPFLIVEHHGEARNAIISYECGMGAFGQSEERNKEDVHQLCPLKKEDIVVKYEGT